MSKRIAFCDAYLIDQQLKGLGLRDKERIKQNEQLITLLDRRAEVLRYPWFNVDRIKKDYPIDGAITSLYEESQKGDRFIQSGAKLEDIKTIHNEFPDIKILVYSYLDDSFSNQDISSSGVSDIIWREEDYFMFTHHSSLIRDWVNNLEEIE